MNGDTRVMRGYRTGAVYGGAERDLPREESASRRAHAVRPDTHARTRVELAFPGEMRMPRTRNEACNTERTLRSPSLPAGVRSTS